MNAGYNSIAVIQCQSNRITRKVNRGNKRRRYAGDLKDAFARRGRTLSLSLSCISRSSPSDQCKAGKHTELTTPKTYCGHELPLYVKPNRLKHRFSLSYLLPSGLSPSALDSHQDPPVVHRTLVQCTGSRARHVFACITAGREFHPAPKVGSHHIPIQYSRIPREFHSSRGSNATGDLNSGMTIVRSMRFWLEQRVRFQQGKDKVPPIALAVALRPDFAAVGLYYVFANG